MTTLLDIIKGGYEDENADPEEFSATYKVRSGECTYRHLQMLIFGTRASVNTLVEDQIKNLRMMDVKAASRYFWTFVSIRFANRSRLTRDSY